MHPFESQIHLVRTHCLFRPLAPASATKSFAGTNTRPLANFPVSSQTAARMPTSCRRSDDTSYVSTSACCSFYGGLDCLARNRSSRPTPRHRLAWQQRPMPLDRAASNTPPGLTASARQTIRYFQAFLFVPPTPLPSILKTSDCLCRPLSTGSIAPRPGRSPGETCGCS